MEAGADPGIFERGGPEAIIHKILERGGPKSLKMAFECSFQLLSYKSFANIPQKGGGGQAPWAPPLNPPQGTEHLEQEYIRWACIYREGERVVAG